MHPSNNLLLPILRKHGDRLLKAQIEAMVKELSWEEQELFLRRQLDASVEAIREKLATSYPDYQFLTEWEPEILKKSLKAWVFALSGEQNYVLGIDDFTCVVILVELGKPHSASCYSPANQMELIINENRTITKNKYRINYEKRQTDTSRVIDRKTGNIVHDMVTTIESRGAIQTKFQDDWLTAVLVKLIN
jgi:fructose-1,6-bisphosphatase/inositol monophosphatase family enzyme